MLSIFLFVVIFSIYIWLFYAPPTPTDAGQPDKERSIVQIIDNRTPIPEQPASIAATEPELVEAARESAQEKDAQAGEDAPIQPSELEPEADAEIEPTLTEEEAIALAVETTLAAGDREGSVPELIRPHPPDPELVEVAIRDAEEKAEDFSPPESVNT